MVCVDKNDIPSVWIAYIECTIQCLLCLMFVMCSVADHLCFSHAVKV